MTQPPVWIDQFLNIGSAACEAVLKAREVRREVRRAERAEVAVPPHWRAGPHAAPAQEPPPTASAPPPSPVMPVVPVPTFARPVAPWEHRRAGRAARSPAPVSPAEEAIPVTAAPQPEAVPPPASSPPTAPINTSPPPEPAPSSTAHTATEPPQPQLELDFTARPTSSSTATSPTTAPEDPVLPTLREAEVATLVNRGVTLIGEVIGEIVSDTLESVLERQQGQLLAILENQDARHAEMLAHHAKAHAAELAALAAASAENLRTILSEVLGERPSMPAARAVDEVLPALAPEIAVELQETLRLGFGEIRGGMNQHHNEAMMVVRNEIRPLAQAALAWLVAQTQAPAPAPEPIAREPAITPSTPTRDLPSAPTLTPRAPPTQRETAMTAAQRQHVHLAIADDDAAEIELDDSESTPLRYRPSDDSTALMPEASP